MKRRDRSWNQHSARSQPSPRTQTTRPFAGLCGRGDTTISSDSGCDSCTSRSACHSLTSDRYSELAAREVTPEQSDITVDHTVLLVVTERESRDQWSTVAVVAVAIGMVHPVSTAVCQWLMIANRSCGCNRKVSDTAQYRMMLLWIVYFTLVLTAVYHVTDDRRPRLQ
ncbi:hypothetical protein J6590_009994 [Homalodisca vitripennis]|nr:hypothetical protein J6590_009994 [Homalodisca vitripennis]